MKWFQHYSDSYTNLKLQELISEFGIEGYGVFWICCELVAQQGINYKIDNGKNWKKALAYIVKLPLAKIDDILTKMGEINLIDKDAYIKNSLFIPKMAEYSDDYSRRVRRVSEHTPNNVRQDKIRLDKNIHTDSAKKPNTEDVLDSDISYLPEDEEAPQKKPQNKAYEAALAFMAKRRTELTGKPFKFEGSRIACYAALKALKKLMSNKRTFEIWEDLCESEFWQEKGFDLWTIKSQFLKKGE